MTNTRWWKNEIGYEVYPRSFQDSNNDGLGDLKGITQRLDYLRSLGVTLLWIAPMYPSPMVDMGYDISDYQAIDPRFGTMADFEELVNEAKKRDIKIVLDLVANHTSDQHDWFKQALADPTSKYRDYYIFKQTSDGKVPNNWRSIFGGSTWTEVPDEPGNYYFHTFAKQQPDLNWENPALRQEMYQMINWWLDKGIAGFRVDAITHLKKDLDWASIEPDAEDGLASVVKKGQNRPGIDLFLQELQEQAFEPHNAVTIGEAYGVPTSDYPKFIGEGGYFSMMFDFSYLNIEVENVDEWYRGRSDWNTSDLKNALFTNQAAVMGVNGWTANVLESHDQERAVSKYIPNPKYQTAQGAKALATMYYYLPGVPFLYQGQELGMKNFHRDSLDQFNDISSINNYKAGIEFGVEPQEMMEIVNLKSRDNARVPMQWDETKYGGFSTVQPWLEMGNDRDGISMATEDQDSNSVLNYYRELARIRRDEKYNHSAVDGEFTPLETAANVVGYKRSSEDHELLVFVNLGEQIEAVQQSNDQYSVVLQNTDTQFDLSDLKLAPYEALVLYK